MKRVVLAAVIFAGGCGGSSLTPDQKAAAKQEWNSARASVLANLAADQLRNGNLERCQDSLDQALRLEPNDPQLGLLAAKLSLEQGKLDVAMGHLSRVREKAPTLAEADYLAGVVQQRWQQLPAARASYRAAAAKDPSSVSYVLAGAEILVSMGREAEALVELNASLPRFEHSAGLRDEIGQLLVRTRSYEPAIAAFSAAVMLAPDDPTLREHLGFACYFAGRYRQAGDQFDRLLVDPAYAGRADILAAKAECDSAAKKPGEALAGYEAATKLDDTNCGYWLGVGRAAVQVKDMETADVAARRAASLSPENPEPRCLLGYVRLKRNDLEGALTAFVAAADLDPRDAVSLCMAGRVADRLGRHDRAKSFYSRALAIDPNDPVPARLVAAAARVAG